MDDELNEDALPSSPKKARNAGRQAKSRSAKATARGGAQATAKIPRPRASKSNEMERASPWDELDVPGETPAGQKGAVMLGSRPKSIRADVDKSPSGKELIPVDDSVEDITETASQPVSKRTSVMKKTPGSRTSNVKSSASTLKTSRAQASRASKRWEVHNVVTNPNSPLVFANLNVSVSKSVQTLS
jgi:hypothetical protein